MTKIYMFNVTVNCKSVSLPHLFSMDYKDGLFVTVLVSIDLGPLWERQNGNVVYFPSI